MDTNKEAVRAFVDWALAEIKRLNQENADLRIDLRRAAVPCGCDST